MKIRTKSMQSENGHCRDFSGDPVVKTLCFRCREHGFAPGQGSKILCAVKHDLKKEKL